MAPVLVELAAQNDLAVPLVAVHMFVFYFGLMADVTPPVGLAAYAAAAISGADPVKTGIQAFHYEIRTGLLPFIFIFNTGLLLIDIEGPVHLVIVVVSAAIAMGCFVAATQNWLLTRNRWYETVALLLICFTLFRPTFWLNLVSEPYDARPAGEIVRIAGETPSGGTLRLKVTSQTRAGDTVDKVLRFTIGPGATGEEKLRGEGLTLRPLGDTMQVANVRFGSEAAKFGLSAGDEIKAVYRPAARPSPYWMAVPALLLLLLLLLLQRRRRAPALNPAVQAS
jgi:hypothetical protein